MSGTWTARVWQEFRAGNLTRAARDVLLTLRTYRGRGGLICPSHVLLRVPPWSSAATPRPDRIPCRGDPPACPPTPPPGRPPVRRSRFPLAS